MSQNRVIVAGIVFFLVSGVITFLLLNDADDDNGEIVVIDGRECIVYEDMMDCDWTTP